MYFIIRKALFVCIFLLLITKIVFAKWHVDSRFGFKIDVPINWSTDSYADGEDMVYDFTSSDKEIAIQLRAFDAEIDLTTDIIAEVFDEEFVSQGAKRISLDYDQLNGIPGKLGVYSNNYSNKEMILVTFSVVKNSIGYLIIVVVPSDKFNQKVQETDAVLNTFTVFKPERTTPHTVETENSLSGSTQKTPASISNNNSKLSKIAPEGYTFNGDVWPAGNSYQCFQIVGQIDISDNHVSWTGGYTNNRKYHLSKGDASIDFEFRCNSGYCIYDGTVKIDDTWTLKISVPQRQEEYLHFKVYGPMGPTSLTCKKIDD